MSNTETKGESKMRYIVNMPAKDLQLGDQIEVAIFLREETIVRYTGTVTELIWKEANSLDIVLGYGEAFISIGDDEMYQINLIHRESIFPEPTYCVACENPIWSTSSDRQSWKHTSTDSKMSPSKPQTTLDYEHSAVWDEEVADFEGRHIGNDDLTYAERRDFAAEYASGPAAPISDSEAVLMTLLDPEALAKRVAEGQRRLNLR